MFTPIELRAQKIVTRRLGEIFNKHTKELIGEEDSSKISSLDFRKFHPELLRPLEVQALRGAILATATFAADSTHRLIPFRPDHEDTTFSQLQAYDELKQHAVLDMYLQSAGLLNLRHLEREKRGVVNRRWNIERELSLMQTYAGEMVRRQVAGLFFRGFAQSTHDSSLGDLLSPMSEQAFRDSQYYLEKSQEVLSADESGSALGQVEEFILEQLPGPKSMQVKRYAKAMSGVGSLDQDALEVSLDQVAQLIGRDRFAILSEDPRFQARVVDQWGIPLPKVA